MEEKRINMKHFRKRSMSRKTVEINAVVKDFIKPFKEMPSTNKPTADRINAHELFSLYTADVIKEDIVYAR